MLNIPLRFLNTSVLKFPPPLRFLRNKEPRRLLALSKDTISSFLYSGCSSKISWNFFRVNVLKLQ